MDESLVAYQPSLAVLPSSAAPAWTQDGGTHTLVGERLQVVSAGGVAAWQRPLFPSDTVRSGNRAADRVEVQCTASLSTFTAGAIASGPIGILLSDGARRVMLAIGSRLELVDPDTVTGEVLLTLSDGWNASADHAYLLRKDGSARWIVMVDGLTLGSIPYSFAHEDPAGAGGYVRWGHVDADGGSDSTSSWGDVEVGLNLSVPKAWRVARLTSALSPRIFDATRNQRWKALVRATVGVFERVLDAIAEAWQEVTANTDATFTAMAAGDKLPSAEYPAWSANGAAPTGWSVVRERLRIDSAAAGAYAAYAVSPPAVGGVAGGLAPGAQDPAGYIMVGATWLLESDDETEGVGPFLMLEGENSACAQLIFDGTSYGWALTVGVGAAPVLAGAGAWPVNPRAEHRVELYAFGRDTDAWALLVVDGVPVDRAPMTAFTNDGTSLSAIVGSYDGTPPSMVAFVRDLVATRARSDLAARPLFNQRAVERMIFRGGCDRNDEVEVWLRNRFGVHLARGSERGLLLELQRLCCSSSAAVQVEARPADWYLNVTYPPVYLNTGLEIVEVVAEVLPVVSFTLEQFGALVAKYMLPMSTAELLYSVQLATLVEGAAGDGGTTWDYPVADTTGFDVDDVVVVHDADDDLLTRYSARLAAVDHVGGTLSILKLDGAEAAAGWTIRRILASTY